LLFVPQLSNLLLLIKGERPKLISRKCDVNNFSLELFDTVN
jgi:hypothetical protein